MNKIDIAREYVSKYLKIARENNISFSKTQIARNMFEENPSIFSSTEDARGQIRKALGVSGIYHRKHVIHYSLEDKIILTGEQFKEVNTEPFIMPEGYNKTLWIADLHSKFMDKRAFEIAVNKGIDAKCNSIIILGDLIDFYEHSKFDKNPLTIARFEDEREWAQDILQLLQETFGYVVFKKGNHDMRRELHVQRLASKMPGLIGLTNLDDFLFFEGSNV